MRSCIITCSSTQCRALEVHGNWEVSRWNAVVLTEVRVSVGLTRWHFALRGEYNKIGAQLWVSPDLVARSFKSTLRWAVLTVLWIGFCLTGLIRFLCVCVCVCLCLCSLVLSCHTAYVLYYCNTVGWTWWDWTIILRTLLQCFETVGWVISSVKTRPRYDTLCVW